MADDTNNAQAYQQPPEPRPQEPGQVDLKRLGVSRWWRVSVDDDQDRVGETA